MSPLFHIGIIGAGPSGLFAAFECGMLSLQACVFESLPHVGGQCSTLYPTKPIYDIPAHPSITGLDLTRNLEKQIERFQVPFFLGESIISVEEIQEGSMVYFKLTSDKGRHVFVRSVIIAAGCGAFRPNRPPLQKLEEFEDRSIFYAVHDPKVFDGKHVLIAGGGDSAIDWAIELHERVVSLCLIHRRAKFRATPQNESLLKDLTASGKINLIVPYQLFELHGQDGVLTHVSVQKTDGTIDKIKCDILLPFFGLSMNLGPLSTLGLCMESGAFVVNPTTCETSRKGIYAIGDVATYPHKRKYILCGFSEGALAVHHVWESLNPTQTFHLQHSTTLLKE